MLSNYKGYRLLLVHAHPDDETINNGSTMAMYAALGAKVTLVTCTRGEEGEVLVPELAHYAAHETDQLGEHRVIELANAMKALGIEDHRYVIYIERNAIDLSAVGHIKELRCAEASFLGCCQCDWSQLAVLAAVGTQSFAPTMMSGPDVPVTLSHASFNASKLEKVTTFGVKPETQSLLAAKVFTKFGPRVSSAQMMISFAA